MKTKKARLILNLCEFSNSITMIKNTIKCSLLVVMAIATTFVSCENETTSASEQESNATEINDIGFDQFIEEALKEQPFELKKSNDTVQTVDFVDLDRYDGRWYEIAKFPNPFEQGCTCTTADYELINGQVNVLNSCILSTTGDVNDITGNAVVVDTATNAKLLLTLDGVPFPSNYWILDLVGLSDNKPYQFAVVGEPSRQNLFILSRTPRIKTFRQKIAVIKILIKLVIQGYDIRNLETTLQNKDCVYP